MFLTSSSQVILKLVSGQLAFEDGEASLTRFDRDGNLETRRLWSNLVDLPIAGPGWFVLSLQNCLVRSLTTGSMRRFPFFRMPARVDVTAFSSGIAEVHVPFHAFARVQVVDHDSAATDQLVVGIVFEQLTLESRVDAERGVNVLGRPGEYRVYLHDERQITGWLVVRDGQKDAGTIELRRP